jgi:predicted O-methyltransferase YrrM
VPETEPTPTRADGFEQAWSAVSGIGGWLTRDQARSLWDGAQLVPAGGRLLEIGSHQGRSTVVLGAAAKSRSATVVAVDPHLAGGMFGGAATREKFLANVAAAGLEDVVELVQRKSTDLRPDWREPLELLYVDGKHDYWTVRDDLRWAEHLSPGAPVFVHDAFSSIGVTLGLLLHVLPGRRLRYVGRVGSLARFEVGPPGARDRLRMVAELPWFLRNVLIKIVLRVGRVFGVRRPDPY